MENNQRQRPYYFSLVKDGDSAIVRILHSNVSTIEKMTSHRIEVDGKKKRAKCLGQDCPLCATGNNAEERIYIHVWDYTDNREKVWERTDKILPELEKVQANWQPLNSAVLKITRKGDSFPKYTVEPLNPLQFQAVDNTLVDEKLAKFYAYNRKTEEVVEFIQTGKFPEKKPYVPKEEYAKQQAQQNQTQQPQFNHVPNPQQTYNTQGSCQQPNYNQAPVQQPITQQPIAQSTPIVEQQEPQYPPLPDHIPVVDIPANNDPFVGDFFNNPRRV